MKRIALADLHLSWYRDSNIQEDGLPKRLSDLISLIRKVCDYARKEKIKNIDILGDLNHDKNIIFTDAQNAFKDIILDYSDLEFLIISGNHDLSSIGDHKTSSISAFEGYSNVSCYTETIKLDNVLLVPWSSTMVVDILEAEACDILLGHFGLSEAQLQSGISIMSNLNMGHLSKFKLILLGHYHKPQEIKNETTRLMYVGSPIHTSWNDKNEDKRFLIYDTETLEVEAIKVSGFTEYREYILDDDSDTKKILEEASISKADGHNVRIRKKTKNKIEENDNDISVIDESDIIDISNRGIDISMNWKEKIEKYAEIMEITDPEYMKLACESIESRAE